MFKNLLLYRMKRDNGLTAEAINEGLSSLPVRELTGYDLKHIGFDAAFKGAELPHLCASKAMIFNAGITERILPATCINKELNARVDAIEEAEDRTIGRKERLNIKDEVLVEMIPKALQKTTYVPVFIDLEKFVIGVGTSSVKAAEEILATIRETVGLLGLLPFMGDEIITHVLTAWACNNSAPRIIDLGEQCKLSDPADAGNAIRLDGFNLNDDTVTRHLDEGMFVYETALEYDEKVTFKLDTVGANMPRFKGIKFSDDLLSEADEEDFITQCSATLLIEISAIYGLLRTLDSSLKLDFGAPAQEGE